MDILEYTKEIEKVEPLNDIIGIVSKELTEEVELKEMFWDKLMEYTMHNNNCLGMAGVQMGMPYRGFYLAIKGLGEFRFRNPVIKQTSTDKVLFKREGCMSLPGEFINTLRYAWVDVEDDINGLQRYTGILSTCIQHEMDHLDGETFILHKAPDNYKQAKIGRNDPCPQCASLGVKNIPKFKKCKVHFR